MPGSVRCSGWGGGLATAPDPGSPPSQGVALVLGSQVTSFFMTMKNKRSKDREREGGPDSPRLLRVPGGAIPDRRSRPWRLSVPHTLDPARGFSTTLPLLPAKRQEWQRARGAVSHWGRTEGASAVRESGGSGSPEPCAAAASRGQGGTEEAILREGGCGGEGGPTSSTSPQRPKPNTAPWLQPCPQD